jgi:hypothetical protein
MRKKRVSYEAQIPPTVTFTRKRKLKALYGRQHEMADRHGKHNHALILRQSTTRDISANYNQDSNFIKEKRKSTSDTSTFGSMTAV